MIFRELCDFEIEHFYEGNPTLYPRNPFGNYYGIIDNHKIIAATCYIKKTDNLVSMQSTMVHPDHRGQGIGRLLNEQLIKHLDNEGVGKIVSHIYVENLPSIILKLKLGYLIEGTLRDHDFEGQHEYVLGKTLKQEKQ